MQSSETNPKVDFWIGYHFLNPPAIHGKHSNYKHFLKSDCYLWLLPFKKKMGGIFCKIKSKILSLEFKNFRILESTHDISGANRVIKPE